MTDQSHDQNDPASGIFDNLEYARPQAKPKNSSRGTSRASSSSAASSCQPCS